MLREDIDLQGKIVKHKETYSHKETYNNYKWNRNNLIDYWDKNGADQLEGIYVRSREVTLYNGFGQSTRQNVVSGEDFFIVRQGDKYLFASFSDKFKSELTQVVGSNSNKFFLSFLTPNSKYYGEDTGVNKLSVQSNQIGELILEDVVYILKKVHRGVHYTNKAEIKDKFSMVYKPKGIVRIDKNEVNVSGTGFAISSHGIIVTNFHVIDGANKIVVRGIDGDFGRSYNAKVLLADKKNDLALIQIEDREFNSLGTIPITIKTAQSEVGEDVFVLGFPLRASMGDEIKLTNGIISSKTGFQGDITSYQISAPVQPGNSGGPLFDKDGNLIGIINAKHTRAENATYAIKSSYLHNLIDSYSNSIELHNKNSLKGKSLSNQVSLVKQFVFIIETE